MLGHLQIKFGVWSLSTPADRIGCNPAQSQRLPDPSRRLKHSVEKSLRILGRRKNMEYELTNGVALKEKRLVDCV